MTEKKLEQPTTEEQQTLNAVENDERETVYLRGRKIRLGWLKHGTRKKITDIILNEKDELKVSAKSAAAISLNGYWGIKILYWLVWRWFYYVKQYTDEEYVPLLLAGKKKVAAENYFLATTLLIGMKTTMMTMKRAEVEHFLQERK